MYFYKKYGEILIKFENQRIIVYRKKITYPYIPIEYDITDLVPAERNKELIKDFILIPKKDFLAIKNRWLHQRKRRYRWERKKEKKIETRGRKKKAQK
jgi:hypothetical protein